MAAIRNIVFDVGNVLVVWDPIGIEQGAFGAAALERPDYISPIRGNPIWLALNRGELTFGEAKARYVEQGLDADALDAFFDQVLQSQALKPDTVAMMRELSTAGYQLFAITDNVREIVAHLNATYDFWPMFEVAAVSAEIGVLKPEPVIYRWLLDTARIDPEQCVFMDDVQRNVDGAKAVGMEAFLFTTADDAREQLADFGVRMSAAQ